MVLPDKSTTGKTGVMKQTRIIQTLELMLHIFQILCVCVRACVCVCVCLCVCVCACTWGYLLVYIDGYVSRLYLFRSEFQKPDTVPRQHDPDNFR